MLHVEGLVHSGWNLPLKSFEPTWWTKVDQVRSRRVSEAQSSGLGSPGLGAQAWAEAGEQNMKIYQPASEL